MELVLCFVEATLSLCGKGSTKCFCGAVIEMYEKPWIVFNQFQQLHGALANRVLGWDAYKSAQWYLRKGPDDALCVKELLTLVSNILNICSGVVPPGTAVVVSSSTATYRSSSGCVGEDVISSSGMCLAVLCDLQRYLWDAWRVFMLMLPFSVINSYWFFHKKSKLFYRKILWRFLFG